MRHLMRLSYVGTHFCGFQVQPRGETVQAALQRAAEKIFASPCSVTGCSRTDSGVHANEYLAVIEEEGRSSIPETAIPRAMNTYLPPDVSVKESVPVAKDFSIRRHVAGKEYMYLLWNHPVRDPFLHSRAFHYFRPLAVEKMQSAAKLFLGSHDFRAFMASGSDVADTVRTITELRVVRDGDLVRIFVSADGFLYNMVRIIVGTLLEVSEGKIDEARLRAAIDGGDRALAGRTAPAEGLYLNRVFLDGDYFVREKTP